MLRSFVLLLASSKECFSSWSGKLGWSKNLESWMVHSWLSFSADYISGCYVNGHCREIKLFDTLTTKRFFQKLTFAIFEKVWLAHPCTHLLLVMHGDFTTINLSFGLFSRTWVWTLNSCYRLFNFSFFVFFFFFLVNVHATFLYVINGTQTFWQTI